MSTVLVLAAAALPLAWMAVVDLRQRRIPNPASLLLVAGGLGAAALGLTNVSLTLALAGALSCFILLFIANRLLGDEQLGLGDVKLAAGVGAWLGPAGASFALAAACLLVVVAAALTRRRGNHPFAPFVAVPTMVLLVATAGIGGSP